ncbi:MAG: iron transporter [Actinobacteria bacterium]|jgi:hypothetical protein|nr:iron transporter [Micrococcales bacterium]MCB0904451.1 iron transporter [Actinomycetota bacterium]MCO5299403.1 iron transporter [Candidatus Nanopelagicales bacterium]MCB9427815.1 iron transporter [Actinomycetota bacterium]HPE11639.1 iron transporter [Actinomycetota bacterium]
MSTPFEKPPMDPDTDEATQRQLDLARAQGDAYAEAVQYMATEVADDGGQKPAGDYIVAYAVEKAEGMYAWQDGGLVWQEPEAENAHIEITVLDGSDKRFVPGLTVAVTVIAPDGTLVGTNEQPMLWHPMIYHYGRNWALPADGDYTLKVHIEPPQFMRHDEINGKRFQEPVEVEFTDVHIERGTD